MRVNFDKKFEDLFADVITQVQKRSEQSGRKPLRFDSVLENTRLLMTTNQVPMFGLEHSKKLQSRQGSINYDERIQSLNKTFTNFKNGRYCLEDNPQSEKKFNIKNVKFMSPRSQSTQNRKNSSKRKMNLTSTHPTAFKE